MRIFAKLCFICNLCFLVSVFMRIWEQAQKLSDEPFTGLVKFQPLLSTIAVLGVLAIFINLIFLSVFFVRYTKYRLNGIGRVVVIFNILILPFQIYYFFFSKF